MNFYAWTGLVNAISTAALAVFVVTRKPRDSRHLTFAVFSLSVAWWSFFYLLWQLSSSEETALILCRLLVAGCLFIPATFLHHIFSLLGSARSHQNQRMIRVNYLIAAVLLLGDATPLVVRGVEARLFFPFWPLPGPFWIVYTGWFVVCVSYTIRLIWRAYGAAEGVLRVQWKYLMIATIIAFAGGSTNFFLWYGIPIPPIGNVVVPFYLIVVALVVIRYQFMDIQIAIRRSVVYSVLIAFITASYLVMVVIMERGFQGFFGYRSLLATVFVAFLIAIFFNPLRTWIQAFVDRALFKATPAELVAQRERLLTEVRRGEQMKAVGTLAAGLAHEIKNPLASIKTFTEHLDTRYQDPAFRHKFRKIVGGEVERIHLIVQQLLEFAKPTPPKLQPVELPQLLDETLEFLNSELVNHHVEVTRDYDRPGRILGDPQQLKQVFLNLFLNSLHAMNGYGRLEVQTIAKEAELAVTITDTGTGITPKDLPHVFEPFYTTKPTGTGLGLAIVQSIIQEHRGRVQITSHPGQGTRITLSLPLAM